MYAHNTNTEQTNEKYTYLNAQKEEEKNEPNERIMKCSMKKKNGSTWKGATNITAKQ